MHLWWLSRAKRKLSAAKIDNSALTSDVFGNPALAPRSGYASTHRDFTESHWRIVHFATGNKWPKQVSAASA